MPLVIPDWLTPDLHDKVFIYTLSDGENIRYVGKSHGIDAVKKRFFAHKTGKRDTHLPKTVWVNSLKNKGVEVVMEILEVVDGNWEQSEIYWIQQLKTWGFNLTNIAEGGDGQQKGYKPSEEALRKNIIKNLEIIDRNSKIKKSEYDSVVEMYKNGVSLREIANKYGVKKTHTVKKILNLLGLYQFKEPPIHTPKGISRKEKGVIVKRIVGSEREKYSTKPSPKKYHKEKINRPHSSWLKGKPSWNKGMKMTDENNWTVGKTTIAQRNEIVELYKTRKYSQREIAEMYGIDQSAVGGICRRRGLMGIRKMSKKEFKNAN